MKTNFKNLFKKMTTVVIVVTMVFSFTATGYAAEDNWNKGKKVNYVPSSGDSSYKSSDWTKSLVDLYQLNWYECPTRKVLKGEFMLVQLRTIQSSLENRGLELLSASKETLNYKDNKTLTASAQEEAKILKSLGILSGNSDGYMKIDVPIKRSEAAKVLAVTNNKVLKIPSIRIAKVFEDTKGHWSEKYVSISYQIALLNGLSNTKFSPDASLTLEQTLQILENEVGYFGITRADVSKAMNETFKVTLDASKSNSLVTKNSYVKYEEKMKTYGFDQFYNNKSAKTAEMVTKAEALKLAIAVIFNTNDISGFAAENNEYTDAIWTEYAEDLGITEEDVTIENYSDKVKYIDVISYFENSKIKFLKDEVIKDSKVYLKDINKYSDKQQLAIKDMLASNIIFPLADSLNGNDYIFKGQLNELVVNYAESYSTIAPEGYTICTDPAKMPSNANLYPYILTEVDKAIYEIPFMQGYDREKKSAFELYNEKRSFYPQIENRMEEFFDSILNVDYRTITEADFKEKVGMYTKFTPADEDISYYVDYVKKNQIIIEGNSQLQFPIIYFDGVSYRARLSLNFEIKHSKTDKNLLYLDIIDSRSKVYSKDSYVIFADYYLTNVLDSHNLYIPEKELYDVILKKESSGIKR